MTIQDYDNFFLPADDLDEAKGFYRDKLGLSIKFDFADKGMTAFKVGENEPAIWFKVNDVKYIM